jgi:predicted transposase/invertase (TIGR01784 family)
LKKREINLEINEIKRTFVNQLRMVMAKTEDRTNDKDIQPVYINPLTDFGFKKLFLNRDLLIAFLNDVVGTDIQEVTYLPTEGLGDYIEERTAIFDLLCTTKSGEYFIVEMQLGKQTFFRDRALLYTSHIIRKQAPRKKNWNYKLNRVYLLAILDFITFTEKSAQNDVIERVFLYRENTGTLFSDKLNMIFIELPKFDKQPSELQNNTDTWLFLLKNTFVLNTCPPEITGEIFKLFLEIAELKKLTPTEMETYKTSLKRSFQVRDIAHCAKLEGIVEGERIGIAKGEQIGIAKGKQIGKIEERKLFAIKLLKRSTSFEDVMDLTDLSKEQVLELLNQMPKS